MYLVCLFRGYGLFDIECVFVCLRLACMAFVFMIQVLVLIVRLDVLTAGDPQVSTNLCFPCWVGYIAVFLPLYRYCEKIDMVILQVRGVLYYYKMLYSLTG